MIDGQGPISRRKLIAGASALGASLGLPSAAFGKSTPSYPAKQQLDVLYRTIEVNGKAAKVYGVEQPNGQSGLTLMEGDPFDLQLTSRIDEQFIMHWHGQEPPGQSDGNPYYFYLQPGSQSEWFYKPRTGTHWMHSHFSLQEQQLMAAPLIVRTHEEMRSDRREVVMMLHDFSFTDPEEILADLSKPKPMGNMSDDPDLNDVDYDAYLTNDRTLDDPEVVQVDRYGGVRLRIINAAAATNFFIDLGGLTGTVVTVDGNPVQPITGSRFPLAVAQRIDIVVDPPTGDPGPWPVLALREGDSAQTGLILARMGSEIRKIPTQGKTKVGAIADDPFELNLRSAGQLEARPVDRKVTVNLTGDMMKYVWGMDADGDPKGFNIKFGERVEINMVNKTPMAHPMHLHGHHFKVLQIGDKQIDGALRDSVLVPPKSSVRFQFDADTFGHWPFHCHILYHAKQGMMLDMAYEVK